MRPDPHDPSSRTAWSPAVLKGMLVPTSAEVRVVIGGATETLLCVGLAEDGFVVEGGRALPLRQLLRCTLRVPDADDLDLFAFAVAGAVERRQEIKPMAMSGAVAERWDALRNQVAGTVRARGTGPTRPLRAGVYMSVSRQRSDWFWRLLHRLR
ncbi:MAG TPA: hypothetical protein VFU21_04535 [Kofleriaceae bacterium]|nr:hypothetical protein [Kofleriaceae bacterium]